MNNNQKPREKLSIVTNPEITEMPELTNKDNVQIFKGKHENNEGRKVRYL